MRQGKVETYQHAGGISAIGFVRPIFDSRFHLQFILMKSVLQFCGYADSFSGRTQTTADFAHTLNIVANDGLTGLVQSVLRDFRRDVRIAVAISANPGAETHKVQIALSWSFWKYTVNGAIDVFVKLGYSFKQDAAVIESHPHFIEDGRCNLSHFVRLP